MKSIWDKIALSCILLTLLTGIFIASDYGDSWDENIRMEAGDLKLSYYKLLLSGEWEEAKKISSIRDLYPGFHDLNLSLIRSISPFSDHLTGNLFSLLWGIMTIIGCWRLTVKIGGSLAGLFSVVLLILTPSFFGHMFINPKDIPLACGYIWSLYAICMWMKADEKWSLKLGVFTGLATGVALSTRIGGMITLCYLAMVITCIVSRKLLVTRAPNRLSEWVALAKKLTPALLTALSIAGLILLFYWPYAHSNPFTKAEQTLQSVTHFDWALPVFFEGNYFYAEDLPRYYIVKMLLIKLPIISLILSFFGMAVTTVGIIKATRNINNFNSLAFSRGMVLFAVIFPIGYVIYRDSVLYNGLRHLLFIIPPLTALAAIGGAWLLEYIRKSLKPIVYPTYALLGVLLTITLINLIRLHPYQYIYYNEFTGGTKTASQRYETDYWGTAYKELAEEFYTHLKSTKPSFKRPLVVVNMEHVTWLFKPFLPDSDSLPIQVVRSNPDEDDYFAASTLWGTHNFHDGPIVVTVDIAGIALAHIKDRRNIDRSKSNESDK